MKNKFYLLDTARPTHYTLELEPSLSTLTFAGTVAIDIDILEATSRIELHSKDLEIKRITLSKENELLSKHTYDEETEKILLHFTKKIQPGKNTIHITFQGKLKEDLRGWYKSAYTAPDGTKKYIATTQFEPTDARRCFPCFDEPAAKATFDVALTVPRQLTAISNMSIDKETTEGTKKRIQFGRTPKMSTYLLAFIVGEFEHLSEKTKNGVTVNVWTTPGKKNQGAFALDVGVKSLDYYTSYFNIPYPLPKLDMIAIPDFESGAMENWGAVTYRETAILIDEKQSSASAKQRVALVVAHELAHQWFGNLVTMHWWNDLWLNEGFASWIEYKAVDHIFPNWKIWQQFYNDETDAAFSLDGLESSHPIEAEVINPAEIAQIFDAVSYNKGASIIHMLEHYVGEDTFREGLQNYIKAHTYGNATTEDLWNAIAQASSKPIKKMMDAWTKQTGYPLITIAQQGKNMTCTQQKFTFTQQKNKALWYVPLSITDGTKKQHYGFEKQSITIPVKSPSFICNAGQSGFYRVRYTGALFQRMRDRLKSLSLLDRVGFESTMAALAEGCYIPVHDYLDVAQQYKQETEYSIWSSIVGTIQMIRHSFYAQSYAPAIDAFSRDLLHPICTTLGWDENKGESHTQKLLRSLVLSAAGLAEEEMVLQEAQKRFTNYIRTKNLNPNLRAVTYMLAARSGDQKTFNNLTKLHQEATLQEEKVRLFAATAWFKQEKILKEMLEFTFSEKVRSQDILVGLARSAANPQGRDLTWQTVQERWKECEERFGTARHLMSSLIKAVCSGFASKEKEREVAEFFKKRPHIDLKQTIDQTLESIRINTAFFNHNKETLGTWIQQKRS